MRTYKMHEVEVDGATLTVYADAETKKVHHGVFHESRDPRTLYPYEPNPHENILDNCTDFYTISQVREKLKRGTLVFR